MKHKEENEEISKLQDPVVTYGGNRVGYLRQEIAAAVGHIDNEAILEKCLKILNQCDGDCELDLAIKEASQGDVVSFDNVQDAMDFLNT